jgi:hypothetical protein
MSRRIEHQHVDRTVAQSGISVTASSGGQAHDLPACIHELELFVCLVIRHMLTS